MLAINVSIFNLTVAAGRSSSERRNYETTESDQQT